MTMRCVVGVWTDDAFSHKASALCATPASAYVWTGADDGVVIRWDNNGNINDEHLQPTMTLLLHQSPIRMLVEVYMGLDMLLSADTSGMLAMWECATCHCKSWKNVPQLREARSVVASQLSGSDFLAVAIAPKNPKVTAASRRVTWEDDTETHFANILGRAGPSSGGSPGDLRRGPPVSTSLLLALIDFTDLNVSKSLNAVASVPLTTHATLQAARAQKSYEEAQQSFQGYRLGRARRASEPVGSGGAASDDHSPSEPHEVALALHSVPYDVVSSWDGQHGASGAAGGAAGSSGGLDGKKRHREDALIAVTNHGRVLVWDTGNSEVHQAPPSDSHGICSMHEPLVAAAIAPSCRYVTILSGTKWAVFQAIAWNPTLLVPMLYSLIHTGSTVDNLGNPGSLPHVLSAPLAGVLFPPVDSSMHRAPSGFQTPRNRMHGRDASSMHADPGTPASPTMAHVSVHSPRTHDSSSNSSELSLVLWDATGAAAVVDIRSDVHASAAAAHISPRDASAPTPPSQRPANVPEASTTDEEVLVAIIAPLIDITAMAPSHVHRSTTAHSPIPEHGSLKGYGVPHFGVSRECGLVRMMAAMNHVHHSYGLMHANGAPVATPSVRTAIASKDSSALADITNFSAFAEQDGLGGAGTPAQKMNNSRPGTGKDYRWDTHVATATLATLSSMRARADSVHLSSARPSSSRTVSHTHESHAMGPNAVTSASLRSGQHALDIMMRSSCLACVFSCAKQGEQAAQDNERFMHRPSGASAWENSTKTPGDSNTPVSAALATTQQYQTVFQSQSKSTEATGQESTSPGDTRNTSSAVQDNHTSVAAGSCMGTMIAASHEREAPGAHTTACAMLSTSATMPPCIAVGRSDGSILMRPLMFSVLRSERHESMHMHGSVELAMHAAADGPYDPSSHKRFPMNCYGLGSNPVTSPDWIAAAAACIRVMRGHKRRVTVLCEADFERSVINIGYTSPDVSAELPIPEHSVATGERAFGGDSGVYSFGRTSPSPPQPPLVTHVHSAPTVAASPSAASVADSAVHSRHARVQTVSRGTTARRLALARGLREQQASLGSGLASMSSVGVGLPLQSSSSASLLGMGSGGAMAGSGERHIASTGSISPRTQRSRNTVASDAHLDAGEDSHGGDSSPLRRGGSGALKGFAAITSFFTGGMKHSRNSFSRRGSVSSNRPTVAVSSEPPSSPPRVPASPTPGEASTSFAHSSSSLTLYGMQHTASPEGAQTPVGGATATTPTSRGPQVTPEASAVSDMPTLSAGPSSVSVYNASPGHPLSLGQHSMPDMHRQHSDVNLASSPAAATTMEVTETKHLTQRVLLSGCAEGRVCAWSVATSSHPQSLRLTKQDSMLSAGNSGRLVPTASAQMQAAREGSGTLVWSGGQPGLMGGGSRLSGGPPEVLGDAWDVFGEPLFSVHALTEPVWQIVLPPQNAPPQWHHTVVVVGALGTAALVDVLSETCTAILQPPIPTPPQEVAWDASRGLLALTSRSSCEPPHIPTATPPPTTESSTSENAPHCSAPPSTLLIWDLHVSQLDCAYVGTAAHTQFLLFLKCLRTHYPHGSGLASRFDPSTAIRHRHAASDPPNGGRATSPRGSTLNRWSDASSISLATDATELTFVAAAPPASGNAAAHVAPIGYGYQPPVPPMFVHTLSANGTPASSAHNTHFGPHSPSTTLGPGYFHSQEGFALPGLSVRPVTRPAAMTPLPSPLKPLILLQMHVGKIASDREEGAVVLNTPGPRWSRRSNEGARPESPTPGGDSKHAQAAMLCTALALAHRWGLDPAADAALANVLVSSLPGASTSSPFHAEPPSTPRADVASVLAAAPFTARLSEDAVLSRTGAAAVQLPTPLSCMASMHANPRSPQGSSSPRVPSESNNVAQPAAALTAGVASSAAAAPTGPPAVSPFAFNMLPSSAWGQAAKNVVSARLAGVLWHASRGWFAVRLLQAASLSRALQSIAGHLPEANAACATLTQLYSQTLTKPCLAGANPLPGIAPLPPPALGVFVASWSASIPSIREASHLIMSACTAPINLTAAQFAELEGSHMHASASSAALVGRTSASGNSPTKRNTAQTATPFSPFPAVSPTSPIRNPPVPAQHDTARDLSTRGSHGMQPALCGWEPVPADAATLSSSDDLHAPHASGTAARDTPGVGTAAASAASSQETLPQNSHSAGSGRTRSPLAAALGWPDKFLRGSAGGVSNAQSPQASSSLLGGGAAEATAAAGREAASAAAAPVATAAQSVTLLPQEVLGILRQPGGTAADPMQVLLSAATCAMQPRSIPASVPPVALARLIDLAMSCPAPHSAAASQVLADMLRSHDSHLWLRYLGPLPPIFSRLHDSLLKVHQASLDTRPAHTPTASAPSGGRASRRPSATPPTIADWVAKLPARHRALLIVSDIRATYYVRDPDQHTSPTPSSDALPETPHSRLGGGIARMLPLRGGNNASSPTVRSPRSTAAAAAMHDAHDAANKHTSPSSRPHSKKYSAPTLAELQNTRDTLTSLLAALATIDFPAFLHSFNMRIAGVHGADPNTPSHTAALNAMLALLRTHGGCETVLKHVVVLADTALRLLDPHYSTRRYQTLNAVAAVMNQLCVRFPMVAAHNPTSAFAVSLPESRLADTRAALTALHAPLSIFNMSTGVKTHVLLFSRAQPAGRSSGGGAAANPLLPMIQGPGENPEVLCGINAIAFRKDGMALAAYSRISGYVYIWTLQPAWAARMSVPGPTKNPFQNLLGGGAPPHATPVQLEPFRVMAAPAVPAPVVAPRPGANANTADLTFDLSWEPDGMGIVLKRDSQVVGTITGSQVSCP